MNHRLHPTSDAARILFVDDVPELRRTVCRTLRAVGYVVVEADSGRTALETIECQPFDMVLSDVMMPDMNGIELLRALRQRDPALPVVLMSALPSWDIAQRAASSGAFDYLSKPIDERLLQATIMRALEVRRPAGCAQRTLSSPTTGPRPK